MRQPTNPGQTTLAHSAAASPLSRRKLFAGATGVGAAAAIATLIPLGQQDAAPLPGAKAAPLKGGGYTLSDHVKLYYKTTLI